jgi:hypothetical protein
MDDNLNGLVHMYVQGLKGQQNGPLKIMKIKLMNCYDLSCYPLYLLQIQALVHLIHYSKFPNFQKMTHIFPKK